jgi:hypothetical protein
MTVPLYSYERGFQGYIPERYALKLERDGIAKLVRHKKGSINRAVLHRRPGDPKPTVLRDYQGQAYSYRHELDDGHRPWSSRPLGHRIKRDQSCEYNLAPQSMPPFFMRVYLTARRLDARHRLVGLVSLAGACVLALDESIGTSWAAAGGALPSSPVFPACGSKSAWPVATPRSG